MYVFEKNVRWLQPTQVHAQFVIKGIHLENHNSDLYCLVSIEQCVTAVQLHEISEVITSLTKGSYG